MLTSLMAAFPRQGRRTMFFTFSKRPGGLGPVSPKGGRMRTGAMAEKDLFLDLTSQNSLANMHLQLTNFLTR